VSRVVSRWLAFIAAMLVCMNAGAAEVTVLTYHDIVTNPGKDKYGVSTAAFEEQLDYLKQHGYHPISLGTYIKASQGETKVPPKAVMLTFDDGLVSYKNNVVPILERYRFPSVLSIVTGWVDGQDQPGEYRGKLLSWNELRQLQKSPLVEIVSHSHDLHHWITSGPQESQSPAGITHRYDLKTRSYESESSFEQRIRSDLLVTRRRFRQMLGHPPLALTWPYGAYDAITMKIARSVGFGYQFTLDEGPAGFTELPDVRRYIVLQEHTLKQFESMLAPPLHIRNGKRFVEFNLDVFAHISPEYHQKLIRQLVHRVRSLGVNTVIVTPFTADHRQAFFPNHTLPVKYDLLNGVLDRLQAHIAIGNIYLRIPETGKSLPITFFRSLARQSRFSAIVFDKLPGTGEIQRIRKTLDKYSPGIKIGSWGYIDPRADFSVVDQGLVKTILESRGQVLVYVDQKNYLTDGGLSDALRALRQKGVRNYGYSSLNYMAGPVAPDELIDAMGPDLSGAAR